MSKVTRARLPEYGVAVGTVLLALLFTWILWPSGVRGSIALFFAAITVSAWYGGKQAGLLATLLSTLVSAFFFIPPIYSMAVESTADVARLIVFVFVGLLISALSGARSRAEQAQRESYNILHAVIEGATDAIFVKDLEGRYVLINSAGAHSVGKIVAEVIGRNDTELFSPETARKIMEHDRVVIATGETKTYEEVATVGGVTRIYLSSKGVRRDENGRIIGLIAISRDITERANLLRREQAARAEAEAAQQQLAFLAEASTLLSTSLDYSATLLIMARLAVPTLADGCVVDALDEKGALQRLAVTYADPAKAELAWEVERRYPNNPNMPYSPMKVFHTGQAEIYAEISDAMLEEIAQDAEHLRMLRELGLKSSLSIPLVARGRALGVVTLVSSESGRRYGPGDVVIAEDLARRAALAVDNARLYREAQEAVAEREEALRRQRQLYEEQSRMRNQAEEAQRQLAFLVEATTLLTSSLDYESRLQSLARLVVPYFADWCAVDMLVEHQSFRSVVVAHSDPSKEAWARELQRRYPTDPKAPRGVPQVLRTGQSELYSEIPDDLLVASAHDAEHLEILRALGLRSAMIVPLVARGRTLGAMTFLSAESGRRYGPADLALAEDLARRAALMVDNARLYMNAQRERAQLEEANRAKDEFLATVSHELRTPLTAIFGWARLLRSGQLDEGTTARALETIERNARAQSQLIEDILDVSRIITGKLRINPRPIRLVSVIEEAVNSIRPAAEAKAIHLQLRLDPAVNRTIGDPDRLQQVIWNLLSNAVKFTPRNGRVEVRLERVDSYAQITVRDSGQGIPADFLPHVFERFRQADGTITRSYGGLGLGLAIVRHLVELHGGTVQAESPGEGEGATLTVSLPIRAVETPPADRGRPTPEAPFPENGPFIRLQGARVLIVDDEADARELVAAILGQRGAQVRTAASAAEALGLLESWRPDVLVSDIAMPIEDGYTLIRKVRALGAERGGQVPAAALTAHARSEDSAQALAAGYQMHIAKPVEPAELAEAVARLAGLNQPGCA